MAHGLGEDRGWGVLSPIIVVFSTYLAISTSVFHIMYKSSYGNNLYKINKHKRI